VTVAIDINAILAAVQSHAQGTGYFDSVVLHEPKSAPSTGSTAAIWANRIRPTMQSGLISVSVSLVLNIRLYASMLQEPQDAIDASLAIAADALFSAYCGDFELGSTARNIDIFGSEGFDMECVFGYINQDGTLFRTADITLPIVVNDVWTEAV
jgi:hypothetical protein